MKKRIVLGLLLSLSLNPTHALANIVIYQLPNNTLYVYNPEKDYWAANGPGVPFEVDYYYEITPNAETEIIQVDYDGNIISNDSQVNHANGPNQSQGTHGVQLSDLKEIEGLASYDGNYISFDNFDADFCYMTYNDHSQKYTINQHETRMITVFNGETERKVSVNTEFIGYDYLTPAIYFFYNLNGGISAAIYDDNIGQYLEFDSKLYNGDIALNSYKRKPLDLTKFPEFTKNYYVEDLNNPVTIYRFIGPVIHVYGSHFGSVPIIMFGREYYQVDKNVYRMDYTSFDDGGASRLAASLLIEVQDNGEKIILTHLRKDSSPVEYQLYLFEDFSEEAYQSLYQNNKSFEENDNYLLTTYNDLNMIDEMWHYIYNPDKYEGVIVHDERINWDEFDYY